MLSKNKHSSKVKEKVRNTAFCTAHAMSSVDMNKTYVSAAISFIYGTNTFHSDITQYKILVHWFSDLLTVTSI
jgi:hypothetical protein